MSILKKIVDWITGAAKKVLSILTFGSNIATGIKTIADSPLLDIIVKLTPTELDDTALAAFRAFMAKFIKDIGWSETVVSQVTDDNVRASILHVLSSAAAKWQADYNKVDLPIQTTLSSQQLIYDAKSVKLV